MAFWRQLGQRERARDPDLEEDEGEPKGSDGAYIWKHILAAQTQHVHARPGTSATDRQTPADLRRHGHEATDMSQRGQHRQSIFDSS